ncbi:MAG: hypothetical protein L0211_24525 [Planctomycetaceae bacterium]|nr:hypothetical protein [Planctomycetaceae bacterium]
MKTKTNARALPLRLTPYAWAKLQRLRDLGDTEVGGFGISAAEDLLLVEDICLIRQQCSSITVKFDDEAVADYFDRQVDQGLAPERFARIWIHTHPGSSPHPSSTDEETFARCFGSADWAVMFILACGGQTYARLRFKAGPSGSLVLPVEVDFSQPFPSSEWGAWDAEYAESVLLEPVFCQPGNERLRLGPAAKEFFDPAQDEWWHRPMWDDVPQLARPFDDEFSFHPHPETEDEYFGASF